MRVDGVWWWRQRLILPVASHPVISAQLALGVIAPSQGAGKWLALCVSQDRGQPGFLSGSLHLTWLCCVSWMVPRIGQAWGHLIAQMTPMGGGQSHVWIYPGVPTNTPLLQKLTPIHAWGSATSSPSYFLLLRNLGQRGFP